MPGAPVVQDFKVSLSPKSRTLNAAERHAMFMRDYVAFYGGGTAATLSAEPSSLLRDSDLSALQRAHRFVRTEQVQGISE